METNFQQTFNVTTTDTAYNLGSGSLPVLATPRLVAMVENTAMKLAENSLFSGQTTVGANFSINHLKPSPVGSQVEIQVELIEHEKNTFKFKYIANEEGILIANGTHTRVAVDADRFMKRLIKND